jgi:type II secretory pathway pseudopilin PulG
MPSQTKSSPVAREDRKTWARRNMHGSHFYLLEYIIMLLSASTLVFVLGVMFTSLFNEWVKVGGNNDPLQGVMGFEAVIGLIVATVILLPLFAILFKRTRNEELKRPEVTLSKWRRAFLYITLGGFIVALLTEVGVVIYTVLRAILGIGVSSFDWKTFIVVIVEAVVWFILYMYTFVALASEANKTRLKQVVSVATLVSVVLVVLVLIFPYRQQRSSTADSNTVSNLSNIQSSVESYYGAHNKLPTQLSDLQFNSSQDRTAALNNGYQLKAQSNANYQLCADFKTASDSSTSVLSASKFDSHGSGHQCFTLNASQYNFSYPYSGSPSNSSSASPYDSLLQSLSGDGSSSL